MRLCAALSLQTRAGANIEETTARPSGASVLCALGLAALAAGCSSRPYGNLVVGAGAPDASTVDMLVATTRAAVSGPPGVIFGGARGSGLDFANILISIPPDSARTPGDVQWPSSPPGDPERSFVTLRVDRVDLAQARADFDARVARTSGRKVLVFVLGYNTRFEEAVYRFAQIVHDAHVDVAPVLFTWPSGGAAIDYIYDRDSAVYSRDALEAVMLASPDIDVDVFRQQIAMIDAGPRPADFFLFVSRDDRALGLSSFLARGSTRIGALDPAKDPYRSILEQAGVHVIDLTSFASNDIANHGKFATGEVVAAIGERLAEGQTLTDAKPGLVESLGTFTRGAVDVAADVITAPAAIADPTKNEKAIDAAESVASTK